MQSIEKLKEKALTSSRTTERFRGFQQSSKYFPTKYEALKLPHSAEVSRVQCLVSPETSNHGCRSCGYETHLVCSGCRKEWYCSNNCQVCFNFQILLLQGKILGINYIPSEADLKVRQTTA